MPQTAAAPRLINVAQAASLLAVSEKTIRRWIDAERIPYLRLPSGGYRIPVGALLASLGGNYALGDELEQIEERMGGVSEDDIRAALE
jgi:excisionase family DNA binding protein